MAHLYGIREPSGGSDLDFHEEHLILPAKVLAEQRRPAGYGGIRIGNDGRLWGRAAEQEPKGPGRG